MDYNADGFSDLLSGSYNGTLYLALGSSEGFSPWTHLLDQQGNMITLGEHLLNGITEVTPAPFAPEVDPMHHAARGEFVTLFDWDGDDDFDLLIGADNGHIYLRRNIGTRSEPAYGPRNEVPLGSDGQPLSTGNSHANVEAGDLNGDGHIDLIAAGSNGAVVGFFNTTSSNGGDAVFAPAQQLLAHTGSHCKLALRPDNFTSADLYDLNNDGKLDIILGCYSGGVWYYEQH